MASRNPRHQHRADHDEKKSVEKKTGSDATGGGTSCVNGGCGTSCASQAISKGKRKLGQDFGLEIVLRNVNVQFTERQVAAEIERLVGPPQVAVTRFKRTRHAASTASVLGAENARGPKKLPLVRVRCAGLTQKAALVAVASRLELGVDDKTGCIAEEPISASRSKAALGKLSKTLEGSRGGLLQLKLWRQLTRPPLLYPDDFTLSGVGVSEVVFVPQGRRFHRGQRCVTAADLGEGREARSQRGTKLGLPTVSLRQLKNTKAVREVSLPPLASRSRSLAIVCATTPAYHRVARSEVFPGDSCLEIGCDTGACCAILRMTAIKAVGRHQRLGKCDAEKKSQCVGPDGFVVGVDLAAQSVAEATKRVQIRETEMGKNSLDLGLAVRFEQLDALGVGAPGRLRAWAKEARKSSKGPSEQSGGFSKVFVDLNGNRELGAVLACVEMVPLVSSSLNPKK